MAKKTISEYLREELDTLKVGESMSKENFIKKHWLTFDYFTKRSFDVVLCNLKKKMSDKVFDSKTSLKVQRVK